MELTEDQVLFFRARRGHLAGPGAPNAVAAARAIIGAQSQQLAPSLLALSMRTKGRPTATKLKEQLLKSPALLVRTWGQRDTLHVYDPKDAWARVVAARQQWRPGARGGPLPSEATLDKALEVMEARSEPVTRTDLLGIAPKSFVAAIQERAARANMDAARLVAARLVWRLAQRGDACVADKVGTEQSYVTRKAWFPKLAWQPKKPLDAAAELTRNYLAVYGPATATDVGHFFGGRVSDAKAWLAKIGKHLTLVSCGGRKGLVALSDDISDLKVKPPTAAAGWPVRLLPLWESMLMGHADKSWTVPDEAEQPLVWRKAGVVAAVVLARGRIVATWVQHRRSKRLAVEVEPLGRWRSREHRSAVEGEAQAVAAHLGLDGADVSIA